MRVCYSGCRWNTVVFAIDDNQSQFHDWLEQISKVLMESVSDDPSNFKVNPRNVPSFETCIVQPSSNPELYPPELRTRLITARAEGSLEPVSTAFLMDMETKQQMEPHQVMSGSYMRPVMKLGYYKEADKFGLTLTVLKGECEPNPIRQMTNDAWQMDT